LHAGVYGTKLPPSAGKRAIAKNNWVQGWKKQGKEGSSTTSGMVHRVQPLFSVEILLLFYERKLNQYVRRQCIVG
jgi:hypothetical protein